MTAIETRNAFLSGEKSAASIVDETLRIIEEREPAVQAFVCVTDEYARQRAAELDARLAAGAPMGALAGVPVAVKDNICTRGLPTTCASRILADFVPPYDAHVIERLLAEDAVIVGKTNMDEFAMGSSTENSAVHTTRNPWDTNRIPGGSSGGSAAAVAAGMVPIALGSDTGGSVRQPAALCGVVGVKPTYGRVSRYGLIAFGSSFDQIGTFGRSVEDAALLLQVISGHDARDSTSADRSVPEFAPSGDGRLDGVTFGLPREFYVAGGMADEIAAALDAARRSMETLGAEFRDVSLPHSGIDIDGDSVTSHAVAAYYVLAMAEAASNLARFDGVKYGHRSAEHEDIVDMYARTRGEGFGAEVKRRIMLGNYALSAGYYDAYFLKAARVRRLIKQDFDRAFEQVDLLLCPVTPTPAFPIGAKSDDPLEMYMSDIFTVPCNLAGIGGIAQPCGLTAGGLPIGMQILAPHWAEAGMLRAAAAFEGTRELMAPAS
jgi:aspartyl-tRNA(Asn)/glutamyl-tRNA(Gln) amidotransferase subunit A